MRTQPSMAAYPPSRTSSAIGLYPSAAAAAASDRLESPKRPLPSGPCNHRDAAIGAPCGCTQFWDKYSEELHEASAESRPSSHRSTWCVCGHHACFHQPEARPVVAERPLAPPAAINNRTQSSCDGNCHIHHPGSQCNARRGLKQPGDELLSVGGSPRSSFGRPRNVHVASSQRYLRQSFGYQVHSPGGVQQPRNGSSQASISGLPRVPSVCLLNSLELSTGSDGRGRQVRYEYAHQARGSYGGLGLLNMPPMNDPTDRSQSVTSTVPDEVSRPLGPRSESEIGSTRANSTIQETGSAGFSRPVGAVHPDFGHLLPHLQMGDTMPDTFNPDDVIRSATEVATPSNPNTPDLRVIDQAVDDSKKLVEALTRLANVENNGAGDTRPNSSSSQATPGQMLTDALTKTPEQLQHAMRSSSPQVLQQIISYLNPLYNLLNSMPNVADTIQNLAARLDSVEQSSFVLPHSDELHRRFDHYEGRVLDLEQRLDDHEKFHAAIDADQSSLDNIPKRQVATINQSFGSTHSSAQSVTSSALIMAAIDRKEMETEIEGIKERLDTLEASAMPTLLDPWEVEVVLLPWGRELRGIWYTPDEPMHEGSRSTTQDTEEWTQARSVRSSSRSSIPFTGSENGWSSQAISDWADTTEDWLSPKACGPTNLVYKRLQSRGFIRNVNLKSSNSGDIQQTLSNAFRDLLDHLEYNDATDGEEVEGLDETINSYPGLKASFIPLRKIRKSSRLRFLTHAEMSSSALWTAQFLASGVLMRVSGSRRRLYVTQREAYLQHNTSSESAWTWQRLRQLPRFSNDSDSQMRDSGTAPVAEGDAKETCWSFYSACDQPPASATSSFNSLHSAPLSIRPAEQPWERSITPTSILKNRHPVPISPISEFPNKRPEYRRTRTVSTSLVEQTPNNAKRRLTHSFDAGMQPQGQQINAHSFTRPSARPSSIVMSKSKRRRVSTSPSPHSHEAARNPHHAQLTAWTSNTPRRSREPPSPFFSSSHPELPRSTSDTTNRSERSVLNAMANGKGTPFAYATPHSGPLVGHGIARFPDEFTGAGDTEPDDSGDEGGDHDDAVSWHGVDDDDHDGSGDTDDVGDVTAAHSSNDASSVVAGAEGYDDPLSFSGEDSDSGLGIESDSDDGDDDDPRNESESGDDDRGDDDEDDDDDGEFRFAGQGQGEQYSQLVR